MLSRSTLAALATLLALTTTVSAFPNGAPGCVVNEARIAKMGGRNTDLGFRIHPSAPAYTPGRPMQFRLEGNKPYKGILLFVSSASNPRVRVGNFGLMPGFKSNKDKCDAQGFMSGPVGALTQSNPTARPPGTVFTWTPDAVCVPAIVEAVVAVEQNVWQILPKVMIACGPGGPMPGPVPPMPIPAPGGDYYDNTAGDHAPAGGDYYDGGAAAPSHPGGAYVPAVPVYDGGGDHSPDHGAKKPCKKPGEPGYVAPPPHGADSGGEHYVPPTHDNDYGPGPHPGGMYKPPHGDMYNGEDVFGTPPHKKRCRKRVHRKKRRCHRRRRHGRKHGSPHDVPVYDGANGGHQDRPEYESPHPVPAPYDGADGGHQDRPEYDSPPTSDYPMVPPHPAPYDGADGGHHDRPEYDSPPTSDYPVMPPRPHPVPAPYDGADGGHHDRPEYDSPPTSDYPVMPPHPVPAPYDGADGGHHDRPEYDSPPHMPPPHHRKKPCRKPRHPMPPHPAPHGDNYGGDEIGEHRDRPAYTPPQSDYPVHDAPMPYDGADGQHETVPMPPAHPPKKPCLKPAHPYPGEDGHHDDKPAYHGEDGHHDDVPVAYGAQEVDHHVDVVAPAYHGEGGDHHEEPSAYFEADAAPIHDNKY